MFIRTPRALVFFVAGFLFCGCVAQAQDGSTAFQPLQVTARLVTLDVVVVDRSGNFVPNLDKSKFHVFENKVPQTIRNFDPPTGHGMPADSVGKAIVHSSADLPKIGDAPVNVLVIDEINTPYMQIAYAQQMMTRYLKKQPEVLPVPTLFIAAGSKHIAVLHDYTQSRADLLDSVKKHVTETDFTAMMASLNGGRKGADYGMAQTLGALNQIATSMQGFPGRKNVIWVGTGYKRAMDATGSNSTDADKIAAVVHSITNRMLAAHMTLYTIDPEGVRGATSPDDTAPSGSPMDGMDDENGIEPGSSFEGFAEATGGRVLFGRNDIEVTIAKTATEGTMYYTLAYSPSSSTDDAKPYRKIRVTVDDPTLRVITRDGYYSEHEVIEPVAANTAKSQPGGLKFDLLSAARTTMVYTGLHSEAVRAKGGYSLLVTAKDLQWSTQEDGSRRAEITVIAVCYDANGKELMQHAAELKERIEEHDNISGGAKVGFAFPMVAPLRTTRIRFVLRDAATGTMGSVNATP